MLVFCFYDEIFFVKQKTAYEMRISDWSSDVCSSDLAGGHVPARRAGAPQRRAARKGRLRDDRGDAETRRGAPTRRARRRAAALFREGLYPRDRKSVV